MERFEEAAQAGDGHACFGVPVDGPALLAAWRTNGARGYWEARLAALDRVGPSILPMAHYNYACVLASLGRRDEALAHLTALADTGQGSVVFLGIEPCLASLRDDPAFEALLTRIGVPRPQKASAPHTASR
jgi:hypothetical protein